MVEDINKLVSGKPTTGAVMPGTSLPPTSPPVHAPNAVLSLPRFKSVPSPNYSGRGATKVDLIVVHDCEGSYAGSVSWFAEERSQVSAHLVLKEDGTEATQMVGYSHKAWHVCDFNSRSIGIEMGGFEKRGFADAEWRNAANIVAYLLHRFKIPVRFRRRQAPGLLSSS